MGSLKLTTASSGSVILSPANTASDVTITVPAVTGTMLTTASTFAGTGPAFSAYTNSGQSISNNVATKIVLNNEDFDTANCFDSTTNYRFTPNVAGYYQINAVITINSAGGGQQLRANIYKNGNVYAYSGAISNTSGYGASSLSSLVYLNGSTDYVELYLYQNTGATQTTDSTARATSFSGFLARAA